MSEAWTILVVEDDPATRASLQLALREAVGAHVEAAACPAEASRKLATIRAPGRLVVLCDYNLRDPRTGLDVLREARERDSGSIRVLMSGEDPPGLPDALEAKDVHAFLPKPFVVQGLRDALPALSDGAWR